MSRMSRQLFLVAGALVVTAGLLAFSLRSASITLGEPTDAGQANPPASLTDTGAGTQGPSANAGALPGSGEGSGLAGDSLVSPWVLAVLGAAGLALTGAGLAATREARSAKDS